MTLDTPPPIDPRYEPPMPSRWALLWRLITLPFRMMKR
jgi:hypothetical protein